MLEEGIILTDLKPGNTLFDIFSRKASVIDVEGYLKVMKGDNIENCKIKNYVNLGIKYFFNMIEN